MPRYELTASRPGSAGVLNTATYNPTTFVPNSINNTTFDAMDRGFYTNYVVDNARPRLVYADPRWHEEAMPVPSGHKPVAVFWRWGELNVNDTDPSVYKLAEGVTPENNLSMSVSQDTISPEQYGLVLYHSDVIQSVTFLDFEGHTMERLGWGLGRIVDALVKNQYNTSLSTFDMATPEGAGPITWKRLVRLRAYLDALNISPPDAEGDYFPMVIHPHQKADMFMDTLIQNALLYSQKGVEMGGVVNNLKAIGEVAGFRFYETTNCLKNTTPTPNRYINVVPGKGLMAATYIQAPDVGQQINFAASTGIGGANNTGGTYSNNAPMPMDIIRHLPGSGGAAGDPLNQLGSWGVKFTHGLKMINSTYGTKVEFSSGYL